MRLLRFWRFGLGAAIALSAGLAFATDPVAYPECTHKATPADIAGAKGAHNAASQFYDRGDYDKAIRYWTDAYGFDCTAHGVLINIANAYEKMGDKASAIVALETYLKRTGGDPTIEQKVKNLKTALQPPPPASASGAPSASAAPLASAAPSATPSAAPSAAPTGPRPFGITPLAVAGGGGAVLLVGVILTAVGSGSISDAEKLCPKRTTCKNQDAADKGNTGRTEQGIGAAGIAIGALAAGGGLVWQFLFNKPTDLNAPPAAPKAAVRVLPLLGPDQAGVGISGSF